jgi:predicted RNase H-like nuclease (RuvC/YqgF family)
MTTEHEVEVYKEVLDIMAARIKKTEQHNAQLSEAIFECRKRVERLNAELEKCARKSIPALAQAQIDQLVTRIGSLEAALRKIAELTRDDLAADIAFAALNTPSNVPNDNP